MKAVYRKHPVIHPELETPSDNTKIWRYLDFTKFVSLLEKRALFFCRSDKIGDPFEGSYPETNVKLRPKKFIGQISNWKVYQHFSKKFVGLLL